MFGKKPNNVYEQKEPGKMGQTIGKIAGIVVGIMVLI